MTLRSHRHPNTDLGCALHHRVGHHSIDAYAGEHECDEAKNHHQQRGETPWCNRVRYELLHRPHVEDRLIFIQSPNLIAHRSSKTERINDSAHKQMRWAGADLIEVKVELGRPC